MTSRQWGVDVRNKYAQVLDMMPLLEMVYADKALSFEMYTVMRGNYSPSMETTKPPTNTMERILDIVRKVVPQFPVASVLSFTHIRNGRLRSKLTSEPFRVRLGRIGLHFAAQLPNLTDLGTFIPAHPSYQNKERGSNKKAHFSQISALFATSTTLPLQPCKI
jgi:hypothetical protein